MTVTQLTLTPRAATAEAVETPIQRIRRLQAETRDLAREQVLALCQDLAELAARAADIAQGGEAFPHGVRDMAERLSQDLPDRAQSMLVISERMAERR